MSEEIDRLQEIGFSLSVVAGDYIQAVAGHEVAAPDIPKIAEKKPLNLHGGPGDSLAVRLENGLAAQRRIGMITPTNPGSPGSSILTGLSGSKKRRCISSPWSADATS